MNPVTAEPGSFRDPLNRVFLSGDEILRGYRGDAEADLEALETSRFFPEAMARGDVVATERADPERLPDDWEAAVRHERIPFISYPYEWTFSMLQDAALLQLRLTREALAEGLITKDATPYNIQFRGPHPVFIDVGSFEKLKSGEPWYGYRQFCQMFLNPLLLQARRDVAFQPWLRGAIGGISPSEMAALLSFRDRWRRGAFTHVGLHARAERRHADSDRDVEAELKRAGFGPAIIDAQLKNVTKAVSMLRWKRSDSTWSQYSDRTHYTDGDLAAKEGFVREVVSRTRRVLVWDLGANDGRFSHVAAESSDLVVAVDSDALVVDRLYRKLRESDQKSILPLAMDLIDSSPPMGWRSRERSAFYERSKPDVVLALALVHHLAIPGTVPPEEIVNWLAATGAEIVVEIPHRDDPMVTRMLRTKRDGNFDHYRLQRFHDELSRHLDLRHSTVLPSGTRTLYHATPRT